MLDPKKNSCIPMSEQQTMALDLTSLSFEVLLINPHQAWSACQRDPSRPESLPYGHDGDFARGQQDDDGVDDNFGIFLESI